MASTEFLNKYRVCCDCHEANESTESPTEWLLTGSVTQLVLAIISKDTRTPLERWVFDIKLVEQPTDPTTPYVHVKIMMEAV